MNAFTVDTLSIGPTVRQYATLGAWLTVVLVAMCGLVAGGVYGLEFLAGAIGPWATFVVLGAFGAVEFYALRRFSDWRFKRLTSRSRAA